MNGRRCSSAPRSICASMPPAQSARTCWLQFDGASLTPLSPWGIRLPPDTRVDDHPAFAHGLVEVQDEGSQLIALACTPLGEGKVIDLCAGAGGKALALAAAAPAAKILATDSNRSRLSKLGAAGGAGRGEHRDSPAEPAARARRVGRLARAGRSRPGRCALLRKRDLAAQSGRAVAADARSPRPRGRAAGAASRSSPLNWSGRADGSSMRFARSCPVRGQGK